MSRFDGGGPSCGRGSIAAARDSAWSAAAERQEAPGRARAVTIRPCATLSSATEI